MLAAVVLVLGMAAFGPVRNFLAQRAEIDRLEQRIAQLETERAQLREQVDLFHDPDYVEKLARCLGMVRPGEIAFVNPEAPAPRWC